MRGSGPAVEQQQPQARVVTDPLHPDPVRTERSLDGNHLRAAAEYVVAAGVVQVVSRQQHAQILGLARELAPLPCSRSWPLRAIRGRRQRAPPYGGGRGTVLVCRAVGPVQAAGGGCRWGP